MSDVHADGSTLRIGSETVDLSLPITTTVEHGDLVVVLVEGEGPDPPLDNVLAFETDGSLAWRAEPVFEPETDENTYVSLDKKSGGIVARDWKGYEYQLDPQTGEHIEKTWRK